MTHPNYVAELCEDGSIKEYEVLPEEFGMNYNDHTALQVGSASESLALIKAIFNGEGPAVGRDMLALNAAAIFYVSGQVSTLADGVEKALQLLASGAAAQTLERVVTLSQKLAAEGK